MDDLLPYFERELVALRRMGRAFHARYPRLGGALQLGDDTCPDPHVEQIIQSVALLSARVAKRLDDSYPELTEALLETLFPHYLRPFPSCSIARATTPAIRSAGEAPLLTIARGTEMDCVVTCSVSAPGWRGLRSLGYAGNVQAMDKNCFQQFWFQNIRNETEESTESFLCRP